MDETLTIRVQREPGYTIVTAAGVVDLNTVAQLRNPLFELADSGHSLVADLDRVSSIDRVGLAALVGATKRAAAHGASLHVVCAPSQLRRLFRESGLDRHMSLFHTLDEALGFPEPTGATSHKQTVEETSARCDPAAGV